ncbi:MAG TPA: hypothetical protein VFP97_07870 [Chitinophagaceae bacterium]|nr:hypothetical protein [Chitinophagaceae bacterium]
MEVHHHSHTPDPGLHRGRKTWTHYFWEFLMLFLAVFCGFLAEYQLEHKIEKDREKQFVRSLINDITIDTTRLNNIINIRNQRSIWLDSLTYIMNSEKPGSFPASDTYYYAIFVPRSVSLRFLPNDGTIQQLKNSGGLRLIHDRKIVDSITSYDAGVRSLVKLGEIEENTIQEYRTIAHKFFDGMVFNSMLDANNFPRRPSASPELYAFTKADLHELNYKLYVVISYNRASRRELKSVLRQAENLLLVLKKEYNFN